ncbi:hypothetical protein AVEN_61054-1 [Araneus ventricosus]|uniref:Histone-lysine N-methyltransferase SETMAR n=1 Tax=Araneus ventricosus TaxID=182803 RepID=A0A4Y2DXZ6_ARAVE|nr:hypothetical protein AVEN_61054-1 [Araneus ventricosus]
MEWRHLRSPTKKKSKQRCQHTKSSAMSSGTDRAFCLLSSFPEVKPSMRYDTVKHCENCGVQFKKRRRMLSQGIVLLHDNARPHSAGVTQNLIQQFGWEQFDHPPYSP